MINSVIPTTNFISHKLEAGMSEVTTDSPHIKVDDLVHAATFFRDFLGMHIKSINEKSCVAVKLNTEMSIFISEDSHSDQTDQIYLNTDDCIEQYCFLKSKGVVFNRAPSYTPDGLMAEFADDFGNRYFLIELRKYNE